MLTGYVEPFFLIGMSMFSHSKKTYGVVTCLLVVFATAVVFIFSNCAIREIKNVSEEPAISGGDTFVIYRDRGVVLDVDAERRLVTVRVDSGSHSSLAGAVVVAPSASLAENAGQNYVLELPFLSWFGHYSALRG